MDLDFVWCIVLLFSFVSVILFSRVIAVLDLADTIFCDFGEESEVEYDDGDTDADREYNEGDTKEDGDGDAEHDDNTKDEDDDDDDDDNNFEDTNGLDCSGTYKDVRFDSAHAINLSTSVVSDENTSVATTATDDDTEVTSTSVPIGVFVTVGGVVDIVDDSTLEFMTELFIVFGVGVVVDVVFLILRFEVETLANVDTEFSCDDIAVLLSSNSSVL